MGTLLRNRLLEVLSPYDMVKDVLGVGLLCGIEFQPPSDFALRLSFEAFAQVDPAMFGQMLVRRLFCQERILTQICGNNFLVLKVAPPLVVEAEQIDAFVGAMQRTVAAIHSSKAFWMDALSLARKAVHI
jgi:ornithine--oxo-acid transaminase